MRTLGASDADLLIALHEGLFEQPLWSGFLERLRVQVGASYAAFVFRPASFETAVHLYAGQDLSDEFQKLFRERFPIDPLPHHRMREGRVYDLQSVMDRDDPRQREFYNVLLVPGGMEYWRSVRITEPSGTEAWLTIINDEDFPVSAGSLLNRLVPHVRLALRSFAAHDRERLRSHISSEAMGRMNFGWLTIDPRCRILDTTQNVDIVFERTNLLRRSRYDRLTFASATIDREVTSLAKAFATGSDNRPRAFQLSQDPWIDILVAPIHERLVAPGSTATAIVYLSGDRWSSSDRCDMLVDLFNLVPSEARLAWAIAQGHSIATAADKIGVTVETARGYSKQIYAKTGAKGQADLVRIIFTSVLAIT
jgi:DNA-binding CsgD family transcriptional regulator